ncbi:hypothetical protein RhiXN_00509 [Rhizoctonia solani]|uniref:Uncharacterized protein n=1 Tax=Rhizoctonia solani TaxID=456999 RepID=A0A8H8NVH8_9AGAM|nr:uncharacterized protein RhiXN_00509 [Rhizoctonia solani]QRW19103.1 hypothetical protein RhiXN_00509 [Rhizoctonia solani]
MAPDALLRVFLPVVPIAVSPGTLAKLAFVPHLSDSPVRVVSSLGDSSERSEALRHFYVYPGSHVDVRANVISAGMRGRPVLWSWRRAFPP